MNAWEREELAIEEQYEDGLMSPAEYNESIRELQRERRWAAEEAAQDAYDQEMDRW